MSIIVSLEGIDGSGKTSQCGLLSHWLYAHKKPFIVTREPGGSPIGQKIREIITQDNEGALSKVARELLFLADRAMHIQDTILPALQEGKIVICDRYLDSSLAYAAEIPHDLLESCNEIVSQGLHPDLTFLLDLPVGVAQDRIAKRGDHEKYDLERLSEIRSNYLAMAAHDPWRIKVLDGMADMYSLHEMIIRYLVRLIDEEKSPPLGFML